LVKWAQALRETMSGAKIQKDASACPEAFRQRVAQLSAWADGGWGGSEITYSYFFLSDFLFIIK
jgi:hypothetical protein